MARPSAADGGVRVSAAERRGGRAQSDVRATSPKRDVWVCVYPCWVPGGCCGILCLDFGLIFSVRDGFQDGRFVGLVVEVHGRVV